MNDLIEKAVKLLLRAIKNKPYAYGFLFVFTLLIIPIIILFFYYIGDKHCVLIETELSVGDALSFYGSFLAFLGTMFLGALALWQNRRLHKENLEITMANTGRPVFVIDKIEVVKPIKQSVPFDKNCFKHSNIKEDTEYNISIKNTGYGSANNLTYNIQNGIGRIPKNRQPCEEISINEVAQITYKLRLRDFKEDSTQIKKHEIIYFNLLGYKYKQLLKINIVDNLFYTKYETHEDDNGMTYDIPIEYDNEKHIEIELLSRQENIGIE